MNRYSRIPSVRNPETRVIRYASVKYPSISLGTTDLYVYTVQGDRYDVMALTYYNDSTLWWIIPSANPYLGFDTLYPSLGAQVRIPDPRRIPTIISNYERINGII
jgi:hypothetical protein